MCTVVPLLGDHYREWKATSFERPVSTGYEVVSQEMDFYAGIRRYTVYGCGGFKKVVINLSDVYDIDTTSIMIDSIALLFYVINCQWRYWNSFRRLLKSENVWGNNLDVKKNNSWCDLKRYNVLLYFFSSVFRTPYSIATNIHSKCVPHDQWKCFV